MSKPPTLHILGTYFLVVEYLAASPALVLELAFY